MKMQIRHRLELFPSNMGKGKMVHKTGQNEIATRYLTNSLLHHTSLNKAITKGEGEKSGVGVFVCVRACARACVRTCLCLPICDNCSEELP